MADRAYRGISPAIQVDKATGRIIRLLRASLTNDPNLKLATLHNRSEGMDLLAELRSALGLAQDADAAAVIATVKAMKDKGGDTTLQAQVKAIALAAGLKEDADAATVLNSVTTLAAGAKAASTEVIAGLQAELTATTALNAIKGDRAKDAATIRPELRRNSTFPILGGSGALATPPGKDKDGNSGLSAEEVHVAQLMGIDPEAYRKTKAAEAATVETLLWLP